MQATIQIDLTSRDDLKAARALIDSWLGGDEQSPETPTVEQAGGSPDITALWPSIGDSSKKLLRMAAEKYAAGEEFSFEELGKHMGLPVGSVKAIHRNLSRGLKARGFDVFDILPARWGGSAQLYWLPAHIRDAILGL